MGDKLRGGTTIGGNIAYHAGNIPTWNQDTTGNAGTATALATGRTIGMTGDVTWTSASFNGSSNVTGTSTLATITDSGTGTFKKITTDTKGRVIGTQAVAQADITGLLGAGSITNTMIANTAVANLSGTNTGDQTITLTGDVTGSGTRSFATTLANSGVTAGTYSKVTVDGKGRVTSGTTLSASDIPTLNQNTTGTAGSVVNSEVIKFDTGTTEGTDLYTFNGSSAKTIDIKAGTNVTLTKAAGSITISANDSSVAWSEITSKPTTLSGYGITDSYTKTELGTVSEFNTSFDLAK